MKKGLLQRFEAFLFTRSRPWFSKIAALCRLSFLRYCGSLLKSHTRMADARMVLLKPSG